MTLVVPRALQPKQPRWFIGTISLAVVSVAVFVAARIRRGWTPGDLPGLTFGTLAALLMVLAAMYAWRRRLTGFPIATAQQWLQVHVYGGTLAGLFVLIHTGFAWPAGKFGWLLWGLSLWTTASGLLGAALQKLVPPMLTHNLTVEAIRDRIPDLVARLQNEARDVADGSSEMLRRFYEAQVRPALAGISPSWSYLLDVHAGRDRRLAAFESLRAVVGDEDRERLEDFRTLVTEKIELEAHYSLQRLLRGWLLLHVPPAMLLLAAIAAHVAAVWYF